MLAGSGFHVSRFNRLGRTCLAASWSAANERNQHAETGSGHSQSERERQYIARSMKRPDHRGEREAAALDQQRSQSQSSQDSISGKYRPADALSIEETKAATVQIQVPQHGACDCNHEAEQQDQRNPRPDTDHHTAEEETCNDEFKPGQGRRVPCRKRWGRRPYLSTSVANVGCVRSFATAAMKKTEATTRRAISDSQGLSNDCTIDRFMNRSLARCRSEAHASHQI